jgi:hypothetical protein
MHAVEDGPMNVQSTHWLRASRKSREESVWPSFRKCNERYGYTIE